MNPDYPKYSAHCKKYTTSYVLVVDADGTTKRFTPGRNEEEIDLVTIHTYDKDGNLVNTEVHLVKAPRGIWDNHIMDGCSRGEDIKNLDNHVYDFLTDYMKKDIYKNDLQEMRIDPKEHWKKWKKSLKEDYENHALNA